MRFTRIGSWTALVACILLTGCGPVSRRIEGLNARRIPKELLAEPRALRQPVNYLLLRQDPPEAYVLDAEDTLGVFIESVLGQRDQPIPFEPDPLGNTPPAVGYPIPIRHDGTISLPLLEAPLSVKGMTVEEAQDAITKAYVENELLTEPRILVSLYRPRTYQVLVVREDGGGQLGVGRGPERLGAREQTVATERGTGYILDMPAYENDVLRALMETGGLPGIDAKPEVKILRGKYRDAFAIAQEKAELLRNVKECEIPPTDFEDPNTIVIPIRLNPDQDPPFSATDIVLGEGDVVVVETRERDVYYTGGLIGGGEVPLPRDYDLDVLAAIAVAGAPIGRGFQFGPGGNFSGFGTGSNLRGSTVAPTEVTIIRETPFGKQFSIKISLRTALIDPSQRILIKPGDIVILDYTPTELLANLILNTFPFDTLFNRWLFNQ